MSYRTFLTAFLLAATPAFSHAYETYRAELTIEFDAQAGKSTPVRMDVEFDALLPRGVSGLIDPHTIVVKRHVQGNTRTYNIRFAENLYY